MSKAVPAEAGRRELLRRSRAATARLAREYGSPNHGNKPDPLDELVFILLSQMTTHQSFNRTFEALKHRCPSWEDVLTLRLSALKAILKPAGLSRIKAPRLLKILRRVTEDFGTATLAPLRRMSDAEAEAYLTSLPGVGVKTAKCVLMYSLGRKVLPADTHVWRISRRLGLVEESVTLARVHAALERVVDPADRYDFHVNAIAHGRAVCAAVRPRCPACVLVDLCAFARLRVAR